MFNEFKKFIMRGNVVDLAIGLIAGTAFTAIVKSLVNDIIMPIISVLFNVSSMENLKITLRSDSFSADGVYLRYGIFLSSIINFLLIMIVLFIFVKLMNKASDAFKAKKEEETKKAEVKVSDEVLLLTQIKEILEKK